MKEILFYNPIGHFTLVQRETNRFMKVYVQTLIAPLISNILFLSVFGSVMSTRQSGIDGIPYLVFLVPGLCAMAAMMAAFQNPAFSLIAQKYTNTIQDLNSYPMTTFEKVFAYIISGTLRGFLIAVMNFIATLFFVRYTIWNPVFFAIMIIIISIIFSSLGLITGLYLNKMDSLNFIISIILTPMIYFGGVFFDISVKANWLSQLAMFNPVYPLIHLTRYAYTGQIHGHIVLYAIITFFIMCISLVTAFIVFNKGIGLKD